MGFWHGPVNAWANLYNRRWRQPPFKSGADFGKSAMRRLRSRRAGPEGPLGSAHRLLAGARFYPPGAPARGENNRQGTRTGGRTGEGAERGVAGAPYGPRRLTKPLHAIRRHVRRRRSKPRERESSTLRPQSGAASCPSWGACPHHCYTQTPGRGSRGGGGGAAGGSQVIASPPGGAFAIGPRKKPNTG